MGRIRWLAGEPVERVELNWIAIQCRSASPAPSCPTRLKRNAFLEGERSEATECFLRLRTKATKEWMGLAI